MCEHLQKPRSAGSRPEAQFFNPLLNGSAGKGLAAKEQTDG